MSAVSENIKKFIHDKGYKQYVIAKKAGYTEQQFNHLLNGRKKITDVDIIRIAKVLEVTPNELFGLEKRSTA